MNSKKQYYLLALFILIATFPNLLLVAIGQDSVVASMLKKTVFSVLCIATVVFPLVFLKPKYYSWFVILLLPLLLFEVSIINHFKAPSSEETVASLFLTNYSEVVELIKGNSLLFIISLLIITTLIFLSFKLKKDFVLSKKIKMLILFFTLGTFTVLYARNFMVSSKLNDNLTETFGSANYSLSVQLHKVFPVDIFLRINGAYKGIKKKKNYKKTIKDFRFSATKKDTIQQQEIYALVIGETARKHNFSKFGYHRKTSPNLDTISNLFAFNQVTTNSNLTSLSIPFILTRATPNNISPKFSEPAVINGFKEAGFKTYWISNQSIGVGSVFGFYSSLADVYKNTSVSLDAANYDDTLFPVLTNVLNDTSTKKKFIIIHTLGSHFRYNYRYPEEFNKFKPSLTRDLSLENTSNISKKQELINSYDNSILFTDYVLNNFIQQLKKENAVSYLYYISDHGENLYDDETEKLLHAYIKPTRYEMEIPLFIWTSNLYRKTYPQKNIYLNKHISKKIEASNTFHTLLDLANIKYPLEKLTKSFANKKFDTLQKRTFYKIDKTVLNLDQ